MRYLIAAILLATAVPSAGQTPETPAFTAARELLLATNFEKQLEASSELATVALLKTLLDDVEQKHGEMPPANRAELETLIKRHNAAVIATIKPTALNETAAVYARYFTAEELRELQRLQTHPVMVKANAVMPGLFAELSQIGAVESFNALPALKEELDAMVARWEEEGVFDERNS